MPEEKVGGRLLVASPDMLDPNFERSVLLLLEHTDDGALGLDLTRPLELESGDVLPAWQPYLTTPAAVFSGGPVERAVAIGLARRDAAPSESWQPLPSGVGVIDLSMDPDDVPGVARLRIFAGYTGWSPGQLEMELAIGSWLSLEVEDGDVFTASPQTLWRLVLRRQRGAAAWYADFPHDLHLN